MNNKSYKYFDNKASRIMTKLRNEVNEKGYRENLGQDELRAFESEVNLSHLMYQEKYQLKSMLSMAIDNL